ncbi:hypothetical protein [uncultured Dokdonia sp.]|uniref:hypothetical protein n=1 Tax=uncultured Dokdonia sp. TaxID=575653 RepID=UPI002619762E|nr:hypothetical protein [uncultured Dokdonia sp.]
MKIKNNTSAKVNPFTIAAIIGVFVLSFFLITKGNSNTPKKLSTTENSNANNINTPTILKEITYTNLFETTDHELYSDDDLNIYIANTSKTPKLIYKYKDKPEGRSLSDNFFMHVYVKDSTKLKGKATYANVDFKQKPEVIKDDGDIYYVFQKDLVSSSYMESYIPIENIAYINTGRFQPNAGRSLDVRKLTVEDIPKDQLKNKLDKINFTINQEAFAKIKAKRNDALSKGILISQDDDIVNGRISLNNEEYQKVELRLKGDWTDHLKHENKWSYRFIMKGENTFKGMRKFSVQHPIVRNYLWEWLFNKVVKENELIGLRYNFAEVNLKVSGSITDVDIPMGIMAVEESFDKILIENNKKREGIIVGFDESLLWKDREKQRILNLEPNSLSRDLHSLRNAQIKIFNENKVLSDPKLSKQFDTAKDLLDGLRNGKYKTSEVFDVDKLATFIALTNLFGGYHGFIWHNLRIYYNPITNKLEPISFDSNSGTRLTKMLEYPMSKNDTVLQEKVLEKLKLVSDSNFINDLIQRHIKELQPLKTDIYTEFTNSFDLDILAHNSNFIKKQINPAVLITADLISYDENHMRIEINNVSGQPVTIENLLDTEGRVLSINKEAITLKEKSSTVVDFSLSNYFVNAFVSKKNKKGAFQYPKDVQKLRVSHYVKGILTRRNATIAPFSKNPNLDKSITYYKKQKEENFQEFSFIEIQEENILVFKEGAHEITKDLIIQAGYTIHITPGCILDFKNEASLLSYATFISNGTKEKPIKFYSSDSSGRGIFISNAAQQSQVSYSTFDNLSNPKSDIWEVSGAVNFHESEVIISNSVFSNNRCEDGLNIIRSSFTMTDTLFESTQSDAFDGDFVTGTLERCTFLNSGNDGIDVSGSELYLKDITIKTPSDKAISAGENSTITGQDIKVFGGEIGVVSKDLSNVRLANVHITDTRLGISAFQKKSEYGVATIILKDAILKDNELDYLIENKSSLILNDIAVETVDDNVIDKMYGNEYGKSSR